MARKRVETNIAYDDVRERYYVNLDYGKDSSGKRVKKSKSFKTKKEAKRCLKEFEADKTKNLLVIPIRDDFKTYSTYWLNMKRISCQETTIYGYKNMLDNHINPAIGDILIQKLNVQDLNNYFSQFKTSGKLSMNTMKKHHNLIKSILKKAMEEEKIVKNPMIAAENISTEQVDVDIYTASEMMELYEKVEGLPLEIPVKLASYLGLRRGEINGLEWKNIDLEKREMIIKVTRTSAGKKDILKSVKTRHSRRKLFIPDELLKALIETKKKQDENKKLFLTDYQDHDRVLCKGNGSLYSPNYCSNELKRFLEKNGLPHIKFHALRHTFASLANEAGMSMFDVSRVLGHSSPSITAKTYTHQFDTGNVKAIEGVANMINLG